MTTEPDPLDDLLNARTAARSALEEANDEISFATEKKKQAEKELATVNREIADVLGVLSAGATSAVTPLFSAETVLRALQNADDWMARRDVADAVGIPADDARNRDRVGLALRSLLQDNRVATNGKEKSATRWATPENAESWTAASED